MSGHCNIVYLLGGVHLVLRSFVFAALVAHMCFLAGHLRFSFPLPCWMVVSPAKFFSSLFMHCLVPSCLAVDSRAEDSKLVLPMGEL